MKRITRIALVFTGLFFPAKSATAQDQTIDGFQAGIYRAKDGKTMPYRLFVPVGGEPGTRYPLILFLHGFEARGKDNRQQIAGMDFAGSHVWTSPENQAVHPCFVLAPQCPKSGLWTSFFSRKPSRNLHRVVELVHELVKRQPIDPGRLYVTGQSIGGYGTWALISHYPGMFAAAVPVCGGGKTRAAPSLVSTPVWAFHGAVDPIVWVFESRRMISAIRKAGGDPKYTEYRFKLHNVWNLAYSEPLLIPWLFKQRLGPKPTARNPDI